MAKLKKPKLEVNKKEKAFIYEIIGIVAILVAIISLAKFGLVGKYLVLSFSLLFGDWYFVFIILVGLFGLYCLIFHKKFELKSIRYYGIVLILLSMLILTHFSMHEYISNYDGNSIKLTFNLYLNYFRTGNTEMIDGGGVIGCIFFYLFYYLLGGVGTVIVTIILFFVGIVFLTKKTIKEFIEIFILTFKKITLFVNKKYKVLLNNVKEISKDYDSNNFLKNIRRKNKNIFIEKEKGNDNKLEIEKAEKITNLLCETFNHLEITFENISYLICEHIIVFFIKTKQDVNYRVLEISLKGKLNENFLVKYDKQNDQILIEINKQEPKTLSLYKASQNISKDEFSIILGIDDRNLLVELDDNVLIIGSDYQLIEKYILSIIAFCVYQKKYINSTLMLLDNNKKFDLYKLDKVIVKNEFSFLDEIITEIDKNLDLLNLHHKKDIEEYNMFFKEKIVKKYLIINQIENFIYDRSNFEKLLYIIQTGKMAGYYTILSLTQDVNLPSVLASSMNQKVILNNYFSSSSKFIDSAYFEFLSENVEGFYKDKDLIIRMSLLMMNENESNKMKKG